MSNLKWGPKDPEKSIGVPGKGHINPADFSQEDLDNLIARAKNRKLHVETFLLSCGLKPVNPQVELDLVDEEFEALKAEYKELAGKDADKRWGKEKLAEKVEELKAIQ